MAGVNDEERSGAAEKVLGIVKLGVTTLQPPFRVVQLSKDTRVSHGKQQQLTAPKIAMS